MTFFHVAIEGEDDGAASWSAEQERHFSTDRPNISAKVNWGNWEHLLPPPPAKVLDMGCNGGHVVARLREMGYSAYGLDLPAVAEVAMSNFPGTWWFFGVNIEFDDIPFSDYDFILALAFIEHLVRWKEFFPKVARVAAPGCKLYLSTTSTVRATEQWHFHHFTADELRELADEAGFDTIETMVPGGEASLAAVFVRRAD